MKVSTFGLGYSVCVAGVKSVAVAAFTLASDAITCLNTWDSDGRGTYIIVNSDTGATIGATWNGRAWILDN